MILATVSLLAWLHLRWAVLPAGRIEAPRPIVREAPARPRWRMGR